MNKILSYKIRKIEESDREWIRGLLIKEWGSTNVVTRGNVHKADLLPGFIADADGERLGLLTYKLERNNCEIISLNSLIEKQGIGSALIEAMKKEFVRSGSSRLWLITTNDNLAAIDFYKKKGFKVVTIHKDAIAESRKLKPEIPQVGINGIPIRDEIEMELIQ